MTLPVSEVFPARIADFISERDDGCWSWHKAHSKRNGYGVVSWRGKQRNVHNLMYELLRGPIPAGLVLDHVVCNDKTCCNPFHVEPATNTENMLRDRKAKPRCVRGHDEWGTDHRGFRQCLACKRDDCRRRARERRGIPPDWPNGKHYNRRGET